MITFALLKFPGQVCIPRYRIARQIIMSYFHNFFGILSTKHLGFGTRQWVVHIEDAT